MIKILLVEDTHLLREGLRLVLKKVSDFELVEPASTGEETLNRVIYQKPDLILLDLGLPDTSGIDLIKQLKEKTPDSHILILTSSDDENKAMEAMSAGADGFCTKTNAHSHLELAIRSVMDGKGWMEPSIGSSVLRKMTTLNASPNKNSYDLSQREIDVIKLVIEGFSNQEIAANLKLSPDTIKSHIRRIMEKMGVNDRTQIAVKAVREDIV